MNAEKHNLDRIYFGGCFIRGMPLWCCPFCLLLKLSSRSSGDNVDIIVRDTLLVKRQKVCTVPETRRGKLSVRRPRDHLLTDDLDSFWAQ